MDIKKLEQANKLREAGAITEEEFEQMKAEILSEYSEAEPEKASKSKVSKISGIIGTVFFVVIIAVALMDFVSTPKCDSIDSDLLGAINNIPLLKYADVTAILVNSSFEKSFNETSKTRYCQANVKLDNTEDVNISYTIQKRSGGEYYIEAFLADF